MSKYTVMTYRTYPPKAERGDTQEYPRVLGGIHAEREPPNLMVIAVFGYALADRVLRFICRRRFFAFVTVMAFPGTPPPALTS